MKDDIARQRAVAAFEECLATHLPLLQDPDVTDVMLNDDGGLWVQRWGILPERYLADFPPSVAETILRFAAGAAGVEITHASPRLMAELPSGARLQGLLPPVVSRPCFVLRLHRERNLTLADYIDSGSMTVAEAERVRAAVGARKNIVIVGATGSGKTTFANAILQELADSDHRVVVIEDVPELQCAAPNTICLRTTPNVSMQDLVFDTLRLNPDRIVPGEIRNGAVAAQVLSAWNTGHPGGLTTIHANSIQDARERFLFLLGEVYATPPAHLVDRVIDLFIFIQRGQAGAEIEISSSKEEP